MDWLSEDELLAAGAAPPGLVQPHPVQSVRLVRTLLGDCLTRPAWPFGAADATGLVALAVDAVTFEVARDELHGDVLHPLTSTFPSTSVVSWLSSVTGLGPAGHGVPGPVHFDEARGGVFNVIRGRLCDWDADTGAGVGVGDHTGGDGARPTTGPVVNRLRTVFDDVAAAGAAPVALVGDLLGISEAWISALVGGATRRDPPRPLDDIRCDPAAVADLAVAQVDRELAEGGRRWVWAYVNLDEHIHLRGYDATVRRVLRDLGRAAERWSQQGCTVVLYADHGQVPTVCDPGQWAAFERWSRPDRCRLPTGGAGRVRWLHPHPAHEAALLAELADVLAGDAVVCHRDDLGLTGLTGEGPLPGVGEVIAIATGKRFPVPDPAYRYEHGSATQHEMLVPLVVWGPR